MCPNFQQTVISYQSGLMCKYNNAVHNENEYSVYTVDFSNPSFNTNTFITF